MKWVLMLCDYIVGLGFVGIFAAVIYAVVRRPYLAIGVAWAINILLTLRPDPENYWDEGLTLAAFLNITAGALTLAAIPPLHRWHIERQRKAGLYWTAADKKPKPPSRGILR